MENNFVDTSQPGYISQFKAADFTPDSNDFFADDEIEDYNQAPTDLGDEENTDDGNPGTDDDSQQSANEVFDQFIEWANSRGIDASKLGIDPETFDEDKMEEEIAKYYVNKKLSSVDPRIMELQENGVSLDEYIEHKNYLNSIANQDPVQLFKASMYDHLLKSESAIGSVTLDKNGNPDEKSVQYLVQEVEKRISSMDQNLVVQRGQQIQEYYKQQANGLPEKLIEQQKHKYSNELQRYNQEVDELTNLMKDKLSKTDNLIIDFSGQAEKDDFVGYMKQNLALQNVQGQQVVPLLYKLQNDADFLANTMRLLYMQEKGYFTDLKNKERNAAFKKLSVVPVLGKNNKQQQTGGPGKFVDTSDPNYQKKYKR
jgi:hypothetical protein